MTIIQLKYAIAVSEYKNFTLAAEKCFVTQPTLSMQIQKLEGELNIQIFDRTKKPIELTDIGSKIINQCKKIVGESEKMKDVVDQDGLVINHGDVNNFAKAFKTLIKDIELRKQLANTYYIKINKHYTANISLTKICDFYITL